MGQHFYVPRSPVPDDTKTAKLMKFTTSNNHSSGSKSGRAEIHRWESLTPDRASFPSGWINLISEGVSLICIGVQTAARS